MSLFARIGIIISLSTFLAFLPSRAENGRIVPLMDSDKMMTLDGEWRFKLLLGKPVLPERFDEPKVVLEGKEAADTVFFRPGFDVSGWDGIKVPGCWDMQGFSAPTYGVVTSQAGLYKREFILPEDWDGGHVFVRFGGVLYSYRVWVNGVEAGCWDSSYNAASFEITPYVKPGQRNEIAVRVDTRSLYYMLDRADNWALSGIFRGVDLMWFPETYISDCFVRTGVPSLKKGVVEADISLGGSPAGGHSLRARLLSPSGRTVSDKTIRTGGHSAKVQFVVPSPELWSAETPSLYSFVLELKSQGRVTQTVRKKVGIREITIKDGVLLLNGKPIKLHGVNSHDLDPETGKTLSMESLRRDVKMWKEGNVNFLRCSHYPPDERKLELCDSAGIYVCDEVPFNFWRDRDTILSDNLVLRGEATVLRDRSHPCVIMWSIGNEEPIRDNTVRVAEKVRSLDPTRLITYPGTSPESTLPAVADLYSPHYPSLDAVRAWKFSSRPFLATEYSHSLGLSFGDNFSEIWKTMMNRPDIAGGAIWHFQDQGILRESVLPVDRSALTNDVWPDPTHYYHASIEGCDGIVYADRTPQADWWLVRDTYSPVQIIEKRLSPEAGEQLRVHVCNQYDFLDLGTVKGKWQLLKNRRVVDSGSLRFACAPHDTVGAVLPVRVPSGLGTDIWTLRMEFTDRDGRNIYEHDINLNGEGDLEALREEILSSAVGRIDIPALIPLARTGRATSLADVTVRDRHFGGENYYWNPSLFKADDVSLKEKDGCWQAKASYWRYYPYVTEHLKAEYLFRPVGDGAVDLEFSIEPVTTTGYFLDAGISWILPEEATVFQWLGDGPFPVYPDRRGNERFGVHRLLKGDLSFNGNRTGVRLALVTDAKGDGLAILADGADIAVEVLGGRIVLSYNSLVSGVGHKKTMSQINHPASEVRSFGGKLTLIPLEAGRWPEALERIFGYPDPSEKPYHPFWYSYDYTM